MNILKKQVTEAEAELKASQKVDNEAQARLEEPQSLSHSTQPVASGSNTQSDERPSNVA